MRVGWDYRFLYLSGRGNRLNCIGQKSEIMIRYSPVLPSTSLFPYPDYPEKPVTAVADVNLDDVLIWKHLPSVFFPCCHTTLSPRSLTHPRSGLRDFEEWLLFVEQDAENLHFILWLEEYNG